MRLNYEWDLTGFEDEEVSGAAAADNTENVWVFYSHDSVDAELSLIDLCNGSQVGGYISTFQWFICVLFKCAINSVLLHSICVVAP